MILVLLLDGGGTIFAQCSFDWLAFWAIYIYIYILRKYTRISKQNVMINVYRDILQRKQGTTLMIARQCWCAQMNLVYVIKIETNRLLCKFCTNIHACNSPVGRHNQGQRQRCSWYSKCCSSFFQEKLEGDINIRLVYWGQQRFVSAGCPPRVHTISKWSSRTNLWVIFVSFAGIIPKVHRLNF